MKTTKIFLPLVVICAIFIAVVNFTPVQGNETQDVSTFLVLYNGNPVSGASVSFCMGTQDGGSGTTNGSGYAYIDVPPGEWCMSASSGSLENAQNVTIAKSGSYYEITIYENGAACSNCYDD